MSEPRGLIGGLNRHSVTLRCEWEGQSFSLAFDLTISTIWQRPRGHLTPDRSDQFKSLAFCGKRVGGVRTDQTYATIMLAFPSLGIRSDRPKRGTVALRASV
jgi:hypothetical protein